jgi:hypothetical protein
MQAFVGLADDSVALPQNRSDRGCGARREGASGAAGSLSNLEYDKEPKNRQQFPS